MKQIISLLSVIVISAFLFTGCATQSSGPNVAAQHALIQMAAATGTQIAITPPTGKPEYTLYFVGASEALSTISTGTNEVSATTIEAALNAGGVTNPIVSLAIQNAITLGNALIQANAGTNQPAQLIAAKEVAGDVAIGIKQGLSLTAYSTLKPAVVPTPVAPVAPAAVVK